MSTFSYEAAWLCLAVTASLGGLVLCKLKKSPGQVGRKVVCLAGCWGGACLLSLSLFWGLILFSLSCFLMHIYLSGQELLPVDQKAVLITASSLCARTRAVLSLQGGVFHSRDLALKDSYTQIIHNLPNLRLDPTNDGIDFCSPANLAPPCGNSRIKDAYSKVVEKVQNRGGDSGIGHALSKYLDHLGFTVFAGVLNEKGSGAEELRRTCSKRLSVLQLDVTDPQQIKDAYSKVVEKVQNRGLWALVNNAGVLGLPADGELIPMTDYKRCMAVNFFGAVEVTKAFLPLLRKSKGRLVNISSMAGGAPMVKLAAYGSSKAALTMFSAVMRQELSKWGVKVAVIQPGGFKTNIAGSSETWDKLEKDMLDHLTPEVLEDYGPDYILAQRNFVGMVHRYSNPDVWPVLRDIRHAISAKSPFTFYTPGSGTYLRLCFVSFSPTGIYDYFNKKLHSSERMPRALSMPNWKNKAT